MPQVTIDQVTFELENLSDAARAQLANVQITDSEIQEGRPGIVRNPQKKRLADCSKTKSHLADAKAGFHRPVLFN